MQLGFVTAIVPDLSFEQVVDFASATGYACIEMMCWPKGKAERRYAGITHIDCARIDCAGSGTVGRVLRRRQEGRHQRPGLLSQRVVARAG